MKRIYLFGIVVLLLVLLSSCRESIQEVAGVSETALFPTLTFQETQISTLSPTPTRTAAPFRTPKPSNISTPTITPVNSADIQDFDLSGLEYDLYWVQNGELVYWDTKNNEMIQWVGQGELSKIKVISPVWDFKISETGKIILVLEDGTVGYISNGENQIHYISSADFVLSVSSYKFSPNGEWLAYTTLEEEKNDSSLYSFNLINLSNDAFHSLPLWYCTDHPWYGNCRTEFVWANDNRSIVWNGSEGLWMTHLGEDLDLLTQHQLYPTRFVFTRFTPVEWSPQGRYLLALQDDLDGSIYVVLDTETKRMDYIPFATIGLGDVSNLIEWLPDGRLIQFLNPMYHFGEHQVAIYTMSANGEEILQKVQRADLPLEFTKIEDDVFSEYVVSFNLNDSIATLILDTASLYGGGDVNLVLRTLSMQSFSMSEPIPLVTLEETSDSRDVFWTEDGNWALWQNDDKVILIDIQKARAIPLLDVFDETSSGFTWVALNEKSDD